MSSFLGGASRKHDPGGPATYRHLLSAQAMTVFNPLRVIAHCDIDAAYAQFEQVRLGISDDVPLICAQWQSIIAVNYPARKFGIKRFNTIDEAKKMCPHLIVQHVATYRNGEAEAGYWGEVDPRTHKVSLDPYRRESLKILAIFKETVPKGEIEKASIDEAFLDLSAMAIERLLARHPHLSTIPDDAPEGMDSSLPPAPPVDWARAGNVFPINGDSEAETHDDDRQEDWSNDGHEDSQARPKEEATWEDWALCMGAEIMAEVRNEVWTRLHYTCSAGIAHNKAMSKLCSAWKKPNNQTVLRSSAVNAFLRNMDFTDIRYLGGKLGNAIATEYGAKTVGDMLQVPLEELQGRFGEESIWVYNILRGVDHTEVTARVATKSMLASKNVRPSVTTPEQGIHWLNVLAGELNVRLRDARDISPGLWPKTLVLSHRTGIEPSRSRQIPFPYTKTLTTEYIVKYAQKLWAEATQPMSKGNMKLNNIALSFTGLERLEEGQKGIESFFGSKPTGVAGDATQKVKRSRSSSPTTPVSSDIVSLESPVGTSPKKPRLPTLHTGKRKTALESFLVKNGESSIPRALTPTSTPIEIIDDEKSTTNTSIEADADVGIDTWTCPRCHTPFTAPDRLDADAKQAYLTGQQHEHADYHFALDLQDVDPPSGTSTSRIATGVKPKVKKTKPEGIKAFFTPKTAK